MFIKKCDKFIKRLSIFHWSFLDALAVTIYVSLVSTIMRNGDKIFGREDNFMSPIAFLLLFICSALITSLLVFGQPLFLFLDGKKKEALRMLYSTTGWLFLALIIAFVILILI